MPAIKRKRGSKDSAVVSKATQKPTVEAKPARKADKEITSRPLKKAKNGESKNSVSFAKPEAAVKAAINTAVVVPGGGPVTIQIVAGSYDRTLHGVTATVSSKNVQFADTFLFNAHTSAIRCLALSPPSVPVPGQGQKVMLATGSTDERINIYNLSAHPGRTDRRTGGHTEADDKEERALLTSIVHRPVMTIAENTKNRELGTLLHHASTVTRLAFPTRSKLLSASEDSTIAVTRTRDWSLLSAIKVPVAKPGSGGASSIHRPSGDTAAPGATPAGVNDFSVHPSMKVMISVSRGERCMRLWNLVTGRKAGVLNFGRDLLRDLGEGRHASGEGRQVQWGRTFASDNDEDSDEFAIGFDRNVVVFGMDSLPRCKLLPDARTKTHDFHYLEVEDDNDSTQKPLSLLAVATEDGRILLASTRPDDLVPAAEPAQTEKGASTTAAPLPCARLIGQIGGPAAGVTGRVKAFKVLSAMETVEPKAKGSGKSQGQDQQQPALQKVWYIVAASSTGALRVWRVTGADLRQAAESSRSSSSNNSNSNSNNPKETAQLGELLGMYQTSDRITCVEAFVMIPRPEGLEESEDEMEEEEGEGEEDDEEDE